MGGIFGKKKKVDKGAGKAAAATEAPKEDNTKGSSKKATPPVEDAEPAPTSEGSGKKQKGAKSSGGQSSRQKAPKEKKDSASEASSAEDDVDIADAIVAAQKKKVTKEDFDLLCVIGRGSFGKVMQVKHKGTGKIYAMKVMRKDAIIAKNQVAHTRDEKSILQRIQHPFIVNLRFAFQTKDKLYMIMDYVNGGELFFHLKKEGKFSEERVRLYAAEISSALMHLHSHGIIYRDLKPENILIDKDGHIVITDFGLSKEVPKDDSTHTFCGTPEYLAPEVLKGQGHSYPVDWWSLGTLIYEMLTGLPPFYSKHINIMYQKILSAPLTFPGSMSDSARSLLEGFLTRDPEKRLGGDAVREHPFFKDLDWDAMERREIEAPWKPPVRDLTDTTQIDEYFTAEKPTDSAPEGSLLDALDDDDKDIFEGFTFAGKTVLDD